ncbi:hypothetical protein BJ508DRAFT_418128, partial [Ascobolus immersus RN42]
MSLPDQSIESFKNADSGPRTTAQPVETIQADYPDSAFSYYGTEYEQSVLSTEKLAQHLPLDNPHSIPLRDSDFGRISQKLPPELVTQILLELDILSLTNLRSVNTYTRSLISVLREYRDVYTYARDALRAMIITGAGAFHTIRKLHSTLVDGNCGHHSRKYWTTRLPKGSDSTSETTESISESPLPPHPFTRLHAKACKGAGCQYCQDMKNPPLESTKVLAPQLYLPDCERICEECFLVHGEREELVNQGYLLLTEAEAVKFFELEPEDVTKLKSVTLRLGLQMSGVKTRPYKHHFDTAGKNLKVGQPLYRLRDIRKLRLEKIGEEAPFILGSADTEQEAKWKVAWNSMEARALDNYVAKMPVLNRSTGEVDLGSGCKACQMGHQFFVYDIIIKSIREGHYQPYIPLIYSKADLKLHLDNCVLKKEMIRTLKQKGTAAEEANPRLKMKIILFEEMLKDDNFIARFTGDSYYPLYNHLFDGFTELL